MSEKIYWSQTKSTGQNFEIYWSDLSDLSHVCFCTGSFRPDFFCIGYQIKAFHSMIIFVGAIKIIDGEEESWKMRIIHSKMFSMDYASPKFSGDVMSPSRRFRATFEQTERQ